MIIITACSWNRTWSRNSAFRTAWAISELLKMEQSAISHQLKILKDAKLVGCRRAGRQNIYFLADDHVRTIIGMGFEHLTETDE